jgi:hypothetical protein
MYRWSASGAMPMEMSAGNAIWGAIKRSSGKSGMLISVSDGAVRVPSCSVDMVTISWQ